MNRDFDPTVIPTVVERPLQGLPFLLESVSDLDCAADARELVTFFERGTGRNL